MARAREVDRTVAAVAVRGVGVGALPGKTMTQQRDGGVPGVGRHRLHRKEGEILADVSGPFDVPRHIGTWKRMLKGMFRFSHPRWLLFLRYMGD